MPSQLVHCKVSRELFGKSFYRIHKAVDSGYFFKGAQHRNFYPHNYAWAIVISKNFYPNDPKALVAANFHFQLDEMCSQNPKLHEQLKRWAKSKVKKRMHRKKRKKKEPMPREFQQFRKDLRNLTEICRLALLL